MDLMPVVPIIRRYATVAACEAGVPQESYLAAFNGVREAVNNQIEMTADRLIDQQRRPGRSCLWVE
jgi:hypothetical protein